MSVSPSDILTTIKNIVTAINGQTQSTLSLAGSQTLENITAPTVVSAVAGRIVKVSVVTAGTSAGMVYDANSLNSTTRPIAPIPNAVGIVEIGMATNFGILVIPGAGQNVTVGYS